MAVFYEWVAEEVNADGDICHLEFFETRMDAESHTLCDPECTLRIALKRDVFSNSDDGQLVDRQYAYISGGRMPEAFDGGALVPIRFRDGA